MRSENSAQTEKKGRENEGDGRQQNNEVCEPQALVPRAYIPQRDRKNGSLKRRHVYSEPRTI